MKESSKNAYWLIGLALVVIVIFFSHDKGEALEEKDYIMALQFDLREAGKTVSFESPILQKDEADSVLDNGQKTEDMQVSHFKDFVENYNNNNAKVLDLHHLKVIIIGRNLLENEEEFKMFLRFLQEQNEFAENIYVAVDGSGGELFNEEEESIGNYLENLIEKKTDKQPQMAVTLGRFLASVYNKNQTLYIPVISKEREITGEWAFACGKPVSFIPEDEAEWYKTGNCINCGCEIYFQDVYPESIDEKQNFSIEISRISRQITFREADNKVIADMVIKMTGKGKDYSGEVIPDGSERYDKEELLSLCLTEKMQGLAKASEGKDLFNTYYELSTKNRSLWIKYQDTFDKYVEKLQLKITVDVDFKD